MSRISIKQINNDTASNGDAIVYDGSSNIWAPVQQVVDRIRLLHVGKHGSDSNDGLTPEKAFLTFGAAITAAQALTPTQSSPVKLFCNDPGVYTESITIPSHVDVDARTSRLQGTVTLSDFSTLRIHEISNSSGILVSKSGVNEAKVYCEILRATDSTNVALNTGTTSVLILDIKQVFVEDGTAVFDDTSGVAGHTHIEIEDLYITGTGVGLDCENEGRIVGRISHILEIAGGIGNGTGINLDAGVIDLMVGRFEVTTAYNASAGTLRLTVNNLTGARIQTSGSVNVDVLETNSLRWISVTSADSPYEPRRIEYLNIDTIGGPIIVDLPVTASDGDTIYFQDATQNFATNSVTFNGNGNTIDGSLTSLVIDTNNRAGQLIFYAATNDWSYSTNSVGQSPENLIYVTKNGNDISGDGSFDKPFLTVKKGVDEANFKASATDLVTVNVLDGVYLEDPITMDNPYVTVLGNSETAVYIKPNDLINPLFTMESTGVGIGPTINKVTLQSTSQGQGNAVFITGDGRFVLVNTYILDFELGIDAGNGTLSSQNSQEVVYDFSIMQDNTVGIEIKSTALLANQLVFYRGNGTAVVALDDSFVEIGNYEIQGDSSTFSGVGFDVRNNADFFANSGRVLYLDVGLIVQGDSRTRIGTTFFINNNNDFDQSSANASIVISGGSLSKDSLLITNGANVALNYLDNDSSDFIVGSSVQTNTPGLEFRVRQFDGRIAVGDQATDANIASGGIGGSRTINIIDSNGNLRIWRHTTSGVDPSIEFINGVSVANPDGFGVAPISSIDSGTNTVVINVSGSVFNDPLSSPAGIDRTTLAERAFPAGRQIRVNGTTSNNADYTVSSAVYNSTNQTISIVVTQNITVSEGAGGTLVFGGGAGRTDGVSTFVGNPAGAVTNGVGNTWWDIFTQEADYMVFRRRTGGGGSAPNEKLRIYQDRLEVTGSVNYDDSGHQLILVAQHNAGGSTHLTINNGSPANGPQLISTGTPADINLRIDPKGSGNLILDGLQWPNTDGTNGQVLTTNGGGVLTWTSVSTASPGGSNTQIQYNNNGAFGGDTGFTTNGAGSVVITGDLSIDNINIDGNTLSSTDTNGNIILTPNGTGNVLLSGLEFPNTDGTNGQVLTTNGGGVLTWTSVSTASPGGSNTQIQYNNNGAFGGDTGFTTNGSGVLTVTGQLNVDNLRFDGNTISSTNTNGNIVLDPNGTGLVVATVGYDMSSGPDNAFATKGYVDGLLSSGGAKRHLYRHNGNTTQTVTTTPVTLLTGTNVRTDTGFTYTAGEITVANAGWYEVYYDASTTGGNSTGTTIWCEVNGTEVGGSRSDTANGGGGSRDEGCVSATIVLNLAANDVVRSRVASLSGTITTVANRCRLKIAQIDSP